MLRRVASSTPRSDVTERFLREWRVEGDRILASLESAFAAGRRAALRPASGPPSRSAWPGCASAMQGDDYLAIKAWIESVDDATKAFAERRMDKHVAKPSPATAWRSSRRRDPSTGPTEAAREVDGRAGGACNVPWWAPSSRPRILVDPVFASGIIRSRVPTRVPSRRAHPSRVSRSRAALVHRGVDHAPDEVPDHLPRRPTVPDRASGAAHLAPGPDLPLLDVDPAFGGRRGAHGPGGLGRRRERRSGGPGRRCRPCRHLLHDLQRSAGLRESRDASGSGGRPSSSAATTPPCCPRRPRNTAMPSASAPPSRTCRG